MSAAALHLLNQMARDARLAWLIGPGSQSFELILEEAAPLVGRSVEDLRQRTEQRLRYEPWPTSSPVEIKPDSNKGTAAQQQALLRRGRRGIAAAAITGNAYALDFWKGFCEALNDLTKGVGARAAEIDAALGECDQQTGLEAAVASLPECTKRLTLADVQQLLAAHGVKLTPDRVPNVDIGSGLVLKHRVLAGLQPNDEHPIARVDARNYSNGHLSSPSTCNSASLVEPENGTSTPTEGGAQ